MRTIIDIPQELLIPLDQLAKEEGVSRAQAVREGIDLLLKEKKKKRKKVTLDDAFGLWKDRTDIGDGVEYQRKLRAEWDHRDCAIDEWIEYQKSHPAQWPKLHEPEKPE